MGARVITIDPSPERLQRAKEFGADRVFQTIEEAAASAADTVHVLTPPLALHGMGRPRTLRVYLPPGYAAGAQRYPVIYMFDGQNLFDDATAYAGEWGVDESMDALAREAGFEAIVVGLDHGGEQRFHELIPYFNVRFLPNQGAAFVDDLVRVVKPFVDGQYRTQPGREHTAIVGSSLGGLSASYAIHRAPDVFGKAGVFSPSYWVSMDAYAHARAAPLPADARVYLYMGGREGGEAVPDVERMAAQLRETLAGPGNVTLHVAAAAEHNEAAWRHAFPVAVRWLYGIPPARAAASRAP